MGGSGSPSNAWFPALSCRYSGAVLPLPGCRPAIAGVCISVIVAISWTCDGWKPLSVAMNDKRRKHRFWMRQICCRRSDVGEFNLFGEMYDDDHMVACICHLIFSATTHYFFKKILCCGKFVTTHYFLSHNTLFFQHIFVVRHMSATQYFLKKIMCCDKLATTQYFFKK